MSWTYLTTPLPDGTMILTWQPHNQRQTRFASDGIVWADPEVTYHHEVRGYTLEILVHRTGYAPVREQIASHSRYRYRIISKGQNATGPNPDPSLWLVHYVQSEQQNRIPVNSLPSNAEMQTIMRERVYLESQGTLPRKEFMLHDRNNYPQLSLSRNAQMPQGPTGYPMAMGRAVQAGNPPPSKRARHAGSAQIPVPTGPSTQTGPPDTSVEDEENTALGDILDNLNPREISSMRFKQHHEWMEEIFSSPYAAGQIVPVDLALGMVGELSHLTEGILDTPGSKPPKDGNKGTGDLETYKKLDDSQLAELENRINRHLENGQIELQKMKDEHAKKMAELRRGKIYLQAERKLREAIWNSTETPATDEYIDEIVRDVEHSLGVTIRLQKDVVCIEKGGLIEEQPVNRNKAAVELSRPLHTNGTNDNIADQGLDNEAAGLLEQFTSNSLASTPGGTTPALRVSQPPSHPQSAAGTPSASAIPSNHTSEFQNQPPVSGPGVGQPSTTAAVDGLDLDIEMGGISESAEDKAVENDWVMIGEGGTDQNDTNNNTNTADSSTLTGNTGNHSNSGMTQPADSTPGIFDSTDFGGFDNLDTAGDALADYTGGGDDMGLDLDNSAFGEAFQATETHQDAVNPS
ncbi:DUF1750-domain-containing protein [Patellaria atrata CBS 101060]|uniref:DUF1750-domain-containing protein n=1 Tax=Patellaria atrata CBS 101060 TaxID=1346257 RepID=A0A9P4VJ61_9PEZI|nr:DUF1750-domain-containing protein [Patellaria atrata CBS 101060]